MSTRLNGLAVLICGIIGITAGGPQRITGSDSNSYFGANPAPAPVPDCNGRNKDEHFCPREADNEYCKSEKYEVIQDVLPGALLDKRYDNDQVRCLMGGMSPEHGCKRYSLTVTDQCTQKLAP